MPVPSLPELKRLLVQERFEIYRTRGQGIVLADRVRENLILDSGTTALIEAEILSVEVVFRARAGDFPGESNEVVTGRARAVGTAANLVGFTEVNTRSVDIADPADSSRSLDVWHEVVMRKAVAGLAELFGELRAALQVEKTATKDAP